MIRAIETADIPELLEIRKQTAASDLFRVDVEISELLRAFPQGQIVFEKEGRIVGFALSRRIDSVESLHRATAEDIHALHAESGQVLVLQALSVMPGAHAEEVGRSLLWAMMAAAKATPGIRTVAGVGRCMHAAASDIQTYLAYLGKAIKEGWASEPALQFHIRHGATVAGFIENYRPVAGQDFGYGVLLQYDIDAIKPFDIKTELKADSLDKRIREITRQHPEIVPLSLAGDGPHTFWIHPMSGDVGMYNRLATQFGNAIKMIGIKARGFLMENREPVSDLVEMAKQYADHIVAVEPHGPYHLAGFSVGGTIAYEVARQLQLQGRTVASLIMVEAPLLAEKDRPLFQSSVRNNLLVNANFMLVTLLSMNPSFKKALENREISWKDVQINDNDIADVSDENLLDRLVELCLQRDVKLTKEEIAFKLKSMADVHMANLRATQNYHAKPLPRPEEINAFVFRTREGRVTSSVLRNPEYVERVQQANGSLLSLLTLWSSLLPRMTTVILDGEDHFDILRSKQGLQKFVGQCIDIFTADAPTAQKEEAAFRAAAPSMTEPVAIIGMSGRFPGAEDVHRFWENLKSGVSSITEAPTSRGWHIDDYFDPVPQTPGKTYSKWGGFLGDVDKFDPLFFGISPREAEVMDPSERIFLQECWRAIEDAGYAATEISGRPWGVFATAKGDYSYHIHRTHETYLAPTDSSAPSRVSYLLNLVGPAVSIDTACSSTLTAVVYACDSLVLGNCEVAIAGGGGIYSTPNFFVSSSQSLLFSPDGKCSPFDHRANGTVLGEAVGVVVLKLLKNAIRDGDHIYGVIRGWATNQDGKTNGMTAPSVTSQTRLQTDVYKKFGIDPARIGMVESHGTGTKLGDPIEVQALAASFRESTQASDYCALAAVKGNIGHAFAGAGITSLIKVLLSLKNKQIPPNLNYEKANPFIKIEGSPFFINTNLMDWQDPGYPRCAAINSFGATGINAHVVVEEFSGCKDDVNDGQRPGTAIILLSAKSADRLEEQARQLLEFLQKRHDSGASLEQVAYTLQVGRVAMEERIAMLVRSFDELEQKLKAFLDGQKRIKNFYLGRATKNQMSEVLLNDDDLDKLTAAWIANGKYEKLLRLWVNGWDIEWRMLHDAGKPRRVSLPAYPFAKERYWYEPAAQAPRDAEYPALLQAGSRIHPLLHMNTSDLSAQKYSSTFTGSEFFLADHVVKGNPVLPGVAYLEMALAAARNAAKVSGDGAGIRIKNVVWARPISVTDAAVDVHVMLTPEQDAELSYEIFTEGADASETKVVHSRGYVQFAEAVPEERLDIAACMAECNMRTLSQEDCYRIFHAVGIDYGRGHRTIKRLMAGRGKALAELTLPEDMVQTLNDFVFHPGLADSALQACIGLLFEGADDGRSDEQSKLLLPFALRELEIRGRCTQAMWAIVSRDSGRSGDQEQIEMNIDLCDKDGRVQARLTGFTARVYAGNGGESPAHVTEGTVMLTPSWAEAPPQTGGTSFAFERHVVLLCDVGTEAVSAELPQGVQIHVLQSAGKSIGERFAYHAAESFRIVQDVMGQGLNQRVFVQIVARYAGADVLHHGLIGLLTTASLENPCISGQLIGVEGNENDAALARLIKENAGAPQDGRVRYMSGKRHVLGWKDESGMGGTVDMPWKDNGVYLLTGGAGGIGLALAKEAALRARNVVLILAGRSELSASRQRAIDEIAATGARVIYKKVDVGIADDAFALLAAIRTEYGAVNGIIHLAGITRDNFIVKKTTDELREVLSPKVSGLVNLDEAAKDDALEFFVLFSSLAGVSGNIGQADYSMANAFMDAYAEYRNGLVRIGQRHGRTISINWPLWKEGGMSPGGAHRHSADLGLTPMASSTGIDIFSRALATESDQLVVMHGEVARITAQIDAGRGHEEDHPASTERLRRAGSPDKENDAPAAGGNDKLLPERTVEFLKKTLASALKVPEHKIDPDAPLEKYGVDSILSMELTTLLEKTFGPLPKTLFFEYQNVRDLAGYFVREYGGKLAAMFVPEHAPESQGKQMPVSRSMVRAIDPATLRRTSVPGKKAEENRLMPSRKINWNAQTPQEGNGDIAIIGLAGRYPNARDMDEFWANLKSGRDCITEVPESRWDNKRYFDRNANIPGKTYCKWGGFIDDVDRFDPLFFNIAPRDAALIDPQERLFLETVWELVESAGYTRGVLRKKFAGQVGVYVGAMYQQYHAMESDPATEAVLSLASYSSIANRVSHFLGLHGPSIALDTMCSSSFSAIHMACESLLKGECQMAIAGGINLSIHPKKYIGLSQARIIGSSPDSRSFGNGDGYLPAEGVGAVLLKPLHKAELDGDVILGVIKGSSVNHGGHTNGFGVPNPNAQAQLIENNFARSGIDPETISYIEAAANGSPLGDAIEMAALNRVFGKYSNKGNFCPIGSVKSNIGHAEAASGMSQLSKVILQMRHRQIVPLVKVDNINPNIRFEDSPFFLSRELTPWTRPVVDIDGVKKEVPRRAMIDAFGAGGSNAHLIVEEYVSGRSDERRPYLGDPKQVVVLSAKTPASLQLMAQRLRAFLETHDDISLHDLAYTLQTGREAMDCRLSLVAGSRDDVIRGLNSYLVATNDSEEGAARVPMFVGQSEDGQALRELFFGTIGENLAAALMDERNPEKLALYWAYGGTVDWELLHRGQDVRRTVLPTYAFERKRCWVDVREEASEANAARPQGNVEHAKGVADILAGLIGIAVDELKPAKPLADYGVDSIHMMQLLSQLQSSIDSSIQAEDLMACRTPQEIIALVNRRHSHGMVNDTAAEEAHGARLAEAWFQFPELIKLNRHSKGIPVFWFHAGMGGVEAYQAIAHKSERPFFGIQARGWGTQREPLQGIQAMAAYYAHIICNVWPDGACDLGGYSLGGVLAYEVTRQLQELGRTVNTIVMLDSPDGNALRHSKISSKTHILRALNTQLSSLILANPADADKVLIHRDEVDSGGSDREYLVALLKLVKKRGLKKPAEKLSGQVMQHVRVQSAYQVDQTVLFPLPRPDEVNCYYFRNRSGVFLGMLEPYFLAGDDEIEMGSEDYWKEWTALLPKLTVIDVDSSNHMSLLTEERPFKQIAGLCETLYSRADAESEIGQPALEFHMKNDMTGGEVPSLN
jgi:acyl transferase domain-containing protein/thioesterase domain-containing protein